MKYNPEYEKMMNENSALMTVTENKTKEPKTYSIVTYGCQMNDNDSEIMSGILEKKGLSRIDDETKADIVLVNTCVVREGAEDRAVARVASLKAAKRNNPDLIIGVTGCMAQKEGDAILKKLPHTNMIIGTRDLFKVGDLVDQVKTHPKSPIISISDVDKPIFLENQPVKRREGIKAFTTIMYGCNNFCSFCIVPKTRGREVSRPKSEVILEIERLASEGYKEVMLLGQNVNSYYDADGVDFADLLNAVSEVDGIERIRYMTSHPKDCDDKLIQTVAKNEKICANFHLPVQAGSNRILRKMKRFYTKEAYLDLVAQVRRDVPFATVTTDLIVGFPGETDEDFEESYDLLEKARWDSAYIFGYSPREGTKSAQWEDNIPDEVKKHRVQRCLGRQEIISGEINAGYIGQTHKVLVESVSKKRSEELMGRTTGDKCIIFPGRENLIGETIDVLVTESHPHTLFGKIVG